MPDVDPTNTPDRRPGQENARAAYPVAVELRHEANRGIWQRFNILLLTNSIILLGVVTALTADAPRFIASVFLSLFGILASWLWLYRIRRARDTIEIYDEAIVRLEGELPGVNTFTCRKALREHAESDLTTWVKATPLGKIGAGELTVLPLTVVYLYLGLLALKPMANWPVRIAAEWMVRGVGLALLVGAILLAGVAVRFGAREFWRQNAKPAPGKEQKAQWEQCREAKAAARADPWWWTMLGVLLLSLVVGGVGWLLMELALYAIAP